MLRESVMNFLAMFILSTTFLLKTSDSQLSENTPPTVYLKRNWILREMDPVGHVIEKVYAKDNEQIELSYGLELININGDTTIVPSLPFAIDNMTGIIYLNETLKGRGGQQISLYVTVSDGQLIAKSEVYVNIQPAYGTGVTRYQLTDQYGNSGILRTPFLRLPALTIPSLNIGQSEIEPGIRTRLLFQSTSVKPTDLNINVLESSSSIDIFRESMLSTKIKSSNTSSNQDIIFTLVPIAAVFALIFGFGMCIWSLRKNICAFKTSKKRGIEYAQENVSTIQNDSSFDLKRWRIKAQNNDYKSWEKKEIIDHLKLKNDRWEFPRYKLKIFSILGEGCFGQVWKSEAHDINSISGATIVAVKTLKENATESERLALQQELKIMKSLEPHQNVVRLLGCCTDREPTFVILEYVNGGKLQNFLRSSRENRNQGKLGLTSKDLTSFVHQVAKGMEYLASKNIIHRDLAARNVLINDSTVCKVADFGFARDVGNNQVYEKKSEGRLPIRWMAPESLYDNVFSVKSDIWSFGVLIWEIVTLGSTPYPGLTAIEVMRRIKEGYRLDRPEHCKRELYNIMYYCWNNNPTCRPSFAELVNLLEGLLLNETDYIELNRFPDRSYYNVFNLSGEKL